MRLNPPPATITAPVRATPALAATSNKTVPFVVPDAPDEIASHGAFVAAVHATSAVTPSVSPLAPPLPTFVLAGDTASAGTNPACTTVQVRAKPLPTTTTAPVRAAPALAATANSTVPFVAPDLPEVIANHGTFVDDAPATVTYTPSAHLLAAPSPTFVRTGTAMSTVPPSAWYS